MKYIILFIFLIHFTMLYSRGAFLSLAIALLFYVVYFKNVKILKYLTLASFAIVYSIYYLYINEYIFFSLDSFSGADNSASSRLIYWKEALFDTNLKQVIFGNGPRTFIDVYGHWLHNSYVARYVDIGVVGLLLYMTILFTSLYIFVKQQNKYLILFLAFIIGSFFVDFYQNALMWFLIGYAYKNPIYYRKVRCEKDKVSIC
ncbi:O-antigen ligase family protein [Aliarcobacter skirrowii]|uniref:O-antigen ligase family protein n=1 Tax=Aliarcobacter skirrowii TaxID=28200 RepID=UPI0013DF6B3B|nr:O-antigen ligase family protein [Aliarcobacter skirrowii]